MSTTAAAPVTAQPWQQETKESFVGDGFPVPGTNKFGGKMAKIYEVMDFDIKLGNEPELVGASDPEHDNAYGDVDDLP